MNNTEKAKYELAKKMLKGRIEVDEVVLMSGLPKDEVIKMDEEINPKNSEADLLKKHDTVDFNIGEILIDNLPADAGFDKGIENMTEEDE